MAIDVSKNIEADSGYRDWLAHLKDKFRSVQIKAAVAVNREMLLFYWDLGADIVEKQKSTSWGERFLPQLSRDLSAEFPEMKGFSVSNLKYMRQWFLFYAGNSSIGQQPVGQIAQPPVSQITRIPWGHNLTIIAKCKNFDEALCYVQNTIAYGWSRSVLTHQIESGLWQREGKAIAYFVSSPSVLADRSSIKSETQTHGVNKYLKLW